MFHLLRKKKKVGLVLFFCLSYARLIDPYKGTPRRSTAGQPIGFLFGSPSRRFPVTPEEDYVGDGLLDERETEEEDSEFD
jgi:hypothetical protein